MKNTQATIKVTLMELELKIPPAIVWFVSALLMWGVHQLIPVEWGTGGLRIWPAAGVAVVGVILGLVGVGTFYRHSTTVNPHRPDNTAVLVNFGVYRLSRNPMYLGLLLLLAATTIYWGNPLTSAGWFLFVGYMNRFQIKPEEQMMAQKFGKAYQEYQSEVGRWI